MKMEIRLLVDAPNCEERALDRFQALRQTCRASVRRRAEMAAALLFSGQVTVVLLEGPADDLADAESSMLALAPGAAITDSAAEGEPTDRLMAAGTCRVGYVDEDHGVALWERASQPLAMRVQHVLELLERSDHD